ncbi:MAG: CocE/NonD family hydrolase [Candidatus Dadabacteria bacterium]|nr:MAG: CocE/NonD family hydrolase [Candidatus Dadabacteria bacterium]
MAQSLQRDNTHATESPVLILSTHDAQRSRSMKPLYVLILAPVVLAGCLGIETSGSQDTRSCDPTAYTPILSGPTETDLMVPMRDCTRLATDVYFADTTAPAPTILVRLPYNKSAGFGDFNLMSVIAGLFTNRGYHFVVQDTRGRFASEGAWEPLVHEADDGIDTVHWIERQPWFDGNLGLFGGSYFGYTQLAIAQHNPASVKTIVPLVALSDTYGMLFDDGLPHLDVILGWSLAMRAPDIFEQPDDDTFRAAAEIWPLSEADDKAFWDLPWYDAWLRHTFRDTYWSDYLDPNVYRHIAVPTLMVAGWFDIFLEQQLQNLADAREAGLLQPDEFRMIIGPWTHAMGMQDAQDYPFEDGRSLLDYLDPIFEWYDHYLQGKPLSNWGPLMMYDGGAGEWFERTAPWPNREETMWHLNATSATAGCLSPGSLGDTPSPAAHPITWTYDPDNIIEVYGGRILALDYAGMIRQERCDRQDILRFESLPFPAPLTWAGSATLRLAVSSTAPDTAFIARLQLVDIDGQAYLLRQDAATLSHRAGPSAPSAYTPGTTVSIELHFAPLWWTFQPGQRLRIDIQSSSFPAYAQHPNTESDWYTTVTHTTARQTVVAGGGQSSFILEVAVP